MVKIIYKIAIPTSLIFLALILFYVTGHVTNDPLIEDVQKVTKQLNDAFFKGVCPKITVKYGKLENSGAVFDTNTNTITLSSNYLSNKERNERPIYEYKNKKELLAHEMCHLCLSNLTHQNSMKEEFRFIDEGFAEIMGRKIAEPETLSNYKKEAILKASKQIEHLSFKILQQWRVYFGDFSNSNEKNWAAYDVGASFIFFILDTYSKEKLYEFFISISKTGDFLRSLHSILKKSEQEIEKEWKDYILAQSQQYSLIN